MTAPHPATTRRGEGVTADGEFYLPTRVLFGRGVAGQAGAHAAGFGARRVMLVTDPGVQAAGLVDPVRAQLTAAGLEVLAFQQVEPNPRDVDCLTGADLAADFRAESFVAVGGGSAIDSAKCIDLRRTNGGHPRDWAGPAYPGPVTGVRGRVHGVPELAQAPRGRLPGPSAVP
jgi:alcohol dehydrogenase class IV